MYCLKCGKPLGRDAEFCSACADNPVTDQSLKATAEKNEEEQERDIRRCPACNQRVFDDLSNCPACGANLPAPTSSS